MAVRKRAEEFIAVDLRPDAALTDAAAAGDVAAFEELYRRHADAAWRVAMAVTRNRHDASDAVSDAFTRVFQALPKGRLAGGVPFRPYLLTSTRNAAVDVLRRTGRLEVTDDVEPHIAHTEGGPQEHLESSEDATLVAQAFSDLPERWRSVLWLTEVEGMPPREVATRLGMSANGAAQLAVRARAGLRERFLQAHLREAPAEECRFTMEHLGAYVAGALSARDLAKVDQHLAGCQPCSARKEELEDLGSTLRRIVVPLPLALGAATLTRWKLASSVAGGATHAAHAGRAAGASIGSRLSGGHRVLAGASAGILAIGVLSAGVRGFGGGGPGGPRSAHGGRPLSGRTTPVVEGFTLTAPPLAASVSLPDGADVARAAPAGATADTPTTPGAAGPSSPTSPTSPTGPTPPPAPKPANPTPMAQVAVGASSGTSGVTAAVGAGDGSCTGANLGGTPAGCAPAPSSSAGISADTDGQSVPAELVHLP
jgi:RNA polymerase sigma factor (sigma-70 family)